MIQALLAAVRNIYIAMQLCALLVFLILDLCGYGLGIFKHLFSRPLTYSGSFHVGDLVLGARPLGPNRQSHSERAQTAARIQAAFSGSPPAYKLLNELTDHYQLQDGALCHFRGENIARETNACNTLQSASRFYLALLAAMHPRNEALLISNVTGHKGDPITAAFFPDKNGKPKILIDLSRVRGSLWDTRKGFRLKAYNGEGVAEIPLQGMEKSRGIFLIDDPGILSRRDARCARPACFARLLLYGYDHEGFRNATTGELSTRNLADLILDADIEKRFAFYTAALGNPVAVPTIRLDTSYKPSKNVVTDRDTALMKRDLDAAMGAGTTSRALFSPVSYNVAFGSVYAFLLDGKPHLIWRGGTPYPSLGTDSFVFYWQTEAGKQPVSPLGHSGGLWVLPIPPASLRSPTLLVHKSIQPAGDPWSSFSDFVAVMAPLSKM